MLSSRKLSFSLIAINSKRIYLDSITHYCTLWIQEWPIVHSKKYLETSTSRTCISWRDIKKLLLSSCQGDIWSFQISSLEQLSTWIKYICAWIINFRKSQANQSFWKCMRHGQMVFVHTCNEIIKSFRIWRSPAHKRNLHFHLNLWLKV